MLSTGPDIFAKVVCCEACGLEVEYGLNMVIVRGGSVDSERLNLYALMVS